mgnify:CR=1 FL=1
MYNKFQSRKFILAMFTILLATGLRAYGLVDVQAWTTVVIAAVSGYLVANVWQGKPPAAE